MSFTYPHSVENSTGETLIFHQVIPEPDGDRVVGENFVAPGSGPPMHVHWLQDEGFTVLSGIIGYQLAGHKEQYAQAGETVVFKRGVPHRFWNAGTDPLHCSAWLKPANSIVFFLSALFAAQKKSGNPRPEAFDAAYLLTRYADEYAMLEVPWLVRHVLMPITYRLGKLLGRYEHFKDAPEPLKRATRLRQSAVSPTIVQSKQTLPATH